MMASLRKKIIIALCIITSVASIAVFSWRNHETFYQNPIDFLIFLRAGEIYNETGQLYQRSDNYADKYHPSAAIFKFPPAFQFFMMPFEKLSNMGLLPGVDLHIFTRLLMTGMYIVSLLLLFFTLSKALDLSGEKQLYFFTFLTLTSMWFMPFFECIRWLLTEIPLLLLFIGSFLLLRKNRFPANNTGAGDLGAGALLGYAFSAKIYPIFLLGYPLAQKNRRALIGFIATVVIVLLLALAVFGIDEHLFYFNNIFPALLNEPVTDKWVNLNIEKWLFIIGILPKVTGTVFYITRLWFVGALGYLLYKHPHAAQKQEHLVFSLFITTMFFCFPNYWPQYQIFLIIPIAYLGGFFIAHHCKKQFLLLIIVIFSLCIPDLLWRQVLNLETIYRGLDIEAIGKESYANGNGITMLKYAPLTWLTYYLYEYRALAPVILWFLQIRQLKK